MTSAAEELPTPEGDDDRMFVLISEPGETVPIADVGDRLARWIEIPLPDARARVRYGRGIIAEDVTRDQADEYARVLRDELALRTVAVPLEEWLDIPRGCRLAAVQFEGTRITASLSTGRSFVIERDDVFALDLFALRPEAGTTGAQNRRSAPVELSDLSPRGRALITEMDDEELHGVEWQIHLYCPPPLGTLRIERDRFDFSFLGDDKRSHSLDNFLSLADRLAAFLPNAYRAEAVTRFLESHRLNEVLRFKREEVQNFERWALWWARVHRDAGGSDAS